MTVLRSTELAALAASAEEWEPPSEFDEFRLVRSLGSGAMGTVYLAHDLLLERAVAVKFVHAGKDPAARAHVIEEARAIARLQHPNVVAIYRVADLAGHPYLVSEYVHGRPLNQVARPLPWRQVKDIATDLARGLAAAHRRGVLHRDVKPGNAILADDGRAKLLDFGLAVILDAGPVEYLAGARAPVVTSDTTLPLDLSLSLGGDTLGPATALSVAQTGDERHPVGTPMYMAPEIWAGEPASRRSDLYSLGILLYELVNGTAPFRDVGLADLPATVQSRAIPPLADVTPGVDPALAAIIDRLVAREPAARFPSADALVAALEDGGDVAALDDQPDRNPYRGLAPFEAAHAQLFFGRRTEIRELVDRVRADALVIVGGDSGTGKSSLCRAGVLPWLAQQDGWSCVEVVPGRHPVRALAAALLPWTSRDEAALVELITDSPDTVARALRGFDPSRRLLLFVDQLEELLTLAVPREARVFAAALAAIAVRSPSVRVLTTCRSDFLSRLAALPELGDELARGLYFLRPLTGEHMREVIVRPAAAKGVVFESDALVDTLIEQTADAPGGLPLLQFTLAELWDARNTKTRTIEAAALTDAGGVGGALSRHADRLLASLSADARDAARRLLLRLITAEGTRIRRTQAELLGDGAAERTALEALVRGRVVVANNTQDGAYEIAHEALVTSWSTLQGWRQQGAADLVVLERVAQAAAAWDRMGRAADLLWGKRQLAEARTLDRGGLARHEVAFLDASSASVRRRRLIAIITTTAVLAGAIAVGVVTRARTQAERNALVADHERAAHVAINVARLTSKQRDLVRAQALARFDSGDWNDGEALWAEVDTLSRREDRAYVRAADNLEGIVLLDPEHAGLRAWVADLSYERLLRAELDHRTDLAEELTSRLDAFDDGRHAAALSARARLELKVSPSDAKVWIERDGAPRLPLTAAVTPQAAGAAVIVMEANGVTARLPVLLARGATLPIDVVLPRTAPPNMVYVPAGRFLFGSGDAARAVFNAAPLHEVFTPGYFIGRNEVTFGDWIAYLDELEPDARSAHTPDSQSSQWALRLVEGGARRWQLEFGGVTAVPTRADLGDKFHYAGRKLRAEQDWRRFPVASISFDEAVAYAAWLDRTGRLPGARLCDEYEWERAARGADGRVYPTGAMLAPDEANIDVTYGRVAFGPDEVGSHPGSRSPVGADDMAGNVWEWTRAVEPKDTPSLRGGSWYQGALTARSMNRENGEPTLRTPLIGMRLCVTPH